MNALAMQFAQRTSEALGKVTVWIYGSVARGDFNHWSDVDILVVAESLPERLPDRLELLFRLALPCVEPKGYTVAEFKQLLAKNCPNLRMMLCDAILLRDDWGLQEGL